MATDRIRTPFQDRQGAQANVGPVDPSTVDTTLQAPSDYLQALQAGAKIGQGGVLIDSSGINLLPNGGFEQGLTGWTTAAGVGSSGFTSPTLDTTTFSEGTQSYTATMVATTDEGQIYSDILDLPSGLIAVRLSADGRAHRTSGGFLSSYFQFLLSFYDSGGVLINNFGTGVVLADGVWGSVSENFFVPANAAQFQVTVNMNNNTAWAGQGWIDNVQLIPIPFYSGPWESNPSGPRAYVDNLGQLRVSAGHPNAGDASINAALYGSPTSTPATDEQVLTIQAPQNGALVAPQLQMRTKATNGEYLFQNGVITPYTGITNQVIGGGGFNNFTPALNTAFQVVGTQTILASPNLSIKTGVFVIVAGDGSSLSAFQLCQLKIGISFDGGSTYSFGRPVQGDVGSGAGGCITLPFAATCTQVGTPTGSITLQVQWAVGGGTQSGFPFQNIDIRWVIQPSL